MRAVGSGISNVGKSQPPGESNIYIHHNIIDNSYRQHGGRPGNFREANWPEWTTIDSFGNHGPKYDSSWKIYNNTLVTRSGGYPSHSAVSYPIPGNPGKYVVNNLVFILDDLTAMGNDLEISGAHYDGNVVFRPNPGDRPLFDSFGDGGDYDSLAEYQANPQTFWCANGLEVDPLLDLTALLDRNNVIPDEQWYLPNNALLNTQGVDLGGMDWPDVENTGYRGALQPLVGSAVGPTANIGATMGNSPNPFNPSTVIRLEIPPEQGGSYFQLKIFNAAGELVRGFPRTVLWFPVKYHACVELSNAPEFALQFQLTVIPLPPIL